MIPEDIQRRKTSPFTLRDKVGRILWGLVWLFFFRPSPRIMHGWRRFVLRTFGAKISNTAQVYPAVKIWAPWNLSIGELVGVADGANLYSQDKIVLDDYVTISQEAYLCTGSHDYRKDDMPLWTAPIHVKRNAWVAARAFVHPGVTIGEGAVVGACSVVKRSIAPMVLVEGNPAQVLRKKNEPKSD